MRTKFIVMIRVDRLLSVGASVFVDSVRNFADMGPEGLGLRGPDRGVSGGGYVADLLITSLLDRTKFDCTAK